MGSLEGPVIARDIRRLSGLSQSALAARAGMAQSALSDYERGVKSPSLTALERLAAAAGVGLRIKLDAPDQGTPSLSAVQSRQAEVLKACRRHGASRPRVFGSVARGDAGPESDVDILVDLERGRTLLDVVGLVDDLVEVLGRKVDLVTSGAVKGRLASILNEAVEI